MVSLPEEVVATHVPPPTPVTTDDVVSFEVNPAFVFSAHVSPNVPVNDDKFVTPLTVQLTSWQ
jgi:hypothetical protein